MMLGLVGINKVLSEDGKTSHLAGKLSALSGSRQAMWLDRVPGLCFFLIIES